MTNRETAIELYQSGLSAQATAERVGSSKKTILRWLKDAGVSRRKGGPDKMGQLEPFAGEIIESYQKGHSGATIAEKYGTTDSTILKFLKLHGIESRKTWSRNPLSKGLQDADEELITEIIYRYENGAKVEEIAIEYGVVASTVWKLLKEKGVTTRARGPVGPEREGDKQKCIDCHEWKRLDEFHTSRKASNGKLSVCKECDWARGLKQYGITADDYHRMLREQEGACRICGAVAGSPRNLNRSKLCVDHCHKGGQVRGLLCHGCNLLLGRADDDPAILRKAAEYLEG